MEQNPLDQNVEIYFQGDVIESDDLDDREAAIFEAGYREGQNSVAKQFSALADRIEETNRDLA